MIHFKKILKLSVQMLLINMGLFCATQQFQSDDSYCTFMVFNQSEILKKFSPVLKQNGWTDDQLGALGNDSHTAAYFKYRLESFPGYKTVQQMKTLYSHLPKKESIPGYRIAKGVTGVLGYFLPRKERLPGYSLVGKVESLFFDSLPEKAIGEMTEKALEDALLQDFFEKKFSAELNPTKRASLGLVSSTILFLGVPYITRMERFSKNYSHHRFCIEVNNDIKTFSKNAAKILWPKGDALIQCECDYAVKKWKIMNRHRIMCEKIEDKIADAQESPNNLPKAVDFIRLALSLPDQRKAFNFHNHQIIDFLTQYFDDYHFPVSIPSCNGTVVPATTIWHKEGVISTLAARVYTHFLESRAPKATARCPRKFLYLLGEASVGKTNLWDNLCKHFGIPLSKVTVSSSKDEFIGNSEQPGSLLRALANEDMQHAVNGSLFLDEAKEFFEEGMIGLLKNNFDPSAPGYEDQHLNTRVDLCNQLIVFASNAVISPNPDIDPCGAMASRMEYIFIPQLKTEAKIKIIKNKKWHNISKLYRDFNMTASYWDEFFTRNPAETSDLRTLESKLSDFVAAKSLYLG